MAMIVKGAGTAGLEAGFQLGKGPGNIAEHYIWARTSRWEVHMDAILSRISGVA